MSVLDLSLRDLEAVAEVASRGHFGRAAAVLRIAQPTISAQVQRVERALGVMIFERTARSFLITADGQKVLPILRQALEAARRLEPAAGVQGDGKGSAPMRMGIIPTLGPYLMPHLLLPMRRQKSMPVVHITEQPTGVLLEMLREGTLDCALLSLPVQFDSIESIPLFDEPFRLIAPIGGDVLGRNRLLPSSLRASEMVLLADGHCLREQALAICGKRGGSAPRLVTTSLETLKYLVAAGEGYSLLPLLACDIPLPLRELVQVRAFDDNAPCRRVGLCFRRTLIVRDGINALADLIHRNFPDGLVIARSTHFPRSGVRCEKC